jgi:hypothetical protein
LLVSLLLFEPGSMLYWHRHSQKYRSRLLDEALLIGMYTNAFLHS